MRASRAAVKVAAGFGLSLLLSGSALAQAAATPPVELPIGYVNLEADPRYDNVLADFEIPVTKWTPTNYDGARMGIVDAEQIGKVIGVDFVLRDTAGPNVGAIAETVKGWVDEGVHFVVADLPAADLLVLSDAVKDLPVTIFNTTAQDDVLRGAECRANLIHTIPSWQMATDAITQYLVFKNWKRILVLQGPEPEDAALVEALKTSANFFGAQIVEVRNFVLSADPRLREENNTALMTEGTNYDVVYIADTVGEFGRNVPYRTNPPRPVVGTAGLTAEAWHWSFERQGAPQATARFFDVSGGGKMQSYDWAGWAAVRAVTQAVLRSKSTDYAPVRDFMLGERLNLDGSKGNPMSIRPWDQQLRQGMLVSTANSVVELAPLQGFLHQTNDLDTLGVDQPRTTCNLAG